MSPSKHPHKNLEAWKTGMNLVEEIYKLTKAFPDNEKYGLISQMRRASVSVPSNIAEGAARKSVKEFIYFLYVAVGSLAELDTQLELSFRMGFIDENTFNETTGIIDRNKALAFGLIKSLKK